MAGCRTEVAAPGVWRLAFEPRTVKRALRIAFVVGLILALINHGPALVAGELGAGRWLQIILTFFVPYLVSTVSSVAAQRDHQSE